MQADYLLVWEIAALSMTTGCGPDCQTTCENCTPRVESAR